MPPRKLLNPKNQLKCSSLRRLRRLTVVTKVPEAAGLSADAMPPQSETPSSVKESELQLGTLQSDAPETSPGASSAVLAALNRANTCDLQKEPEPDTSLSKLRHGHLNRFLRSVKSWELSKNWEAYTDLLEDFFNCKGLLRLAEVATYETLVHRQRTRRSLKRRWMTLKELEKRYHGEEDYEALAMELFLQKCGANMVRDHPEFPKRPDLRQAKVYDMEEEVSESEDERETGAAHEAETNEEDSDVETVITSIATCIGERPEMQLKLQNSGVSQIRNDKLMEALSADMDICAEALRGRRETLESATDEAEVRACIDATEKDITNFRNAMHAAKKSHQEHSVLEPESWANLPKGTMRAEICGGMQSFL
eukprot:s658_g11.t1